VHANELLENFDVEFFAVKHEGKVNLNTYIGIVLTMKSYQLVSCCCRQRQNTVHTLSTSVFQKSVLFGFSTKSFEWQHTGSESNLSDPRAIGDEVSVTAVPVDRTAQAKFHGC